MSEQEQYELPRDVHKALPMVQNARKSCFVKGSYEYYHYKCDGFNDVGWGCGYRTLQSVCSWIINAKQLQICPPHIRMIQKLLIDIGDKPSAFYESQEWIGAIEVSMVVNTLYHIDCRILHISNGKELPNFTALIYDHFQTFGSPVMMGGEQDNSSKGIMGIASTSNQDFLLVVDPHFVGKANAVSTLIDSKFVRWQALSSFYSGFYNLVLPLLHLTENSDSPM